VQRAKGLASIVAAVLLTTVAVVGAMLIYLWLAGFITKATSQAEQMAASEKLKIEAAMLDDAGSATLYVRNLGGDAVTLVTAYILRPGTITPICGPADLTAAPITIDPGALQEVSIAFGCSLSAGNDYVIKIVTRRGTEFAVTVSAS